MTKALPFTKASIRRRIEAAREAGLRVKGIAPDGTIMVDNDPPGLAPSDLTGPDRNASKWEDVQA
ncbi:hypothetical protein ACSVBT_06840 [Afipia sp. TerB]